MLSSSDYPLPAALDSAYGNSTILALEADTQKIQAPETKKIIFEKGLYKGDSDITRFLEPHTAQDLEKYLAGRGIAFEQIVKFKPWLLSVTLLGIELQRLGQGGTGVDEFYCQKALDEKRTITYLETIPEQLEFLSHMGEGAENAFMQYTLKDLKDLPDTLQAIKDAWRTGDIARLQKVAVDPLENEFPDLYASLLVERNNSWIKRIEAMLSTAEVELVLVGSLHLVGSDGILAQLKKRGYCIENI